MLTIVQTIYSDDIQLSELKVSQMIVMIWVTWVTFSHVKHVSSANYIIWIHLRFLIDHMFITIMALGSLVYS